MVMWGRYNPKGHYFFGLVQPHESHILIPPHHLSGTIHDLLFDKQRGAPADVRRSYPMTIAPNDRVFITRRYTYFANLTPTQSRYYKRIVTTSTSILDGYRGGTQVADLHMFLWMSHCSCMYPWGSVVEMPRRGTGIVTALGEATVGYR